MNAEEIGVKCPKCGVIFKSKQLPIYVDLGFRNSELRVDYKGALGPSERYAISECPSCGKADWITEFHDTQEMSVLQAAENPPHLQFRAAAVDRERNGGDNYNIGLFYLHAAWCADDDGVFVQAREYRRMAADFFNKSVIDGSCPPSRRQETEYMIGEIMRRSGDFANAVEHFRRAIPKLSGQFALMARKLTRLAQSYNSDPIDFESGEAQ